MTRFVDWLRDLMIDEGIDARLAESIVARVQREAPAQRVYIHALERVIDFDAGVTVEEIARENGVHKRTIYRKMHRVRSSGLKK